VDSLRGQLLIAAPTLADFFRRTVVLVLEHNDEGAMGVVLNRPSEVEVADAVPPLAELVEPGEVVWVGGPVSPTSAVVLAEFEDEEDAASLVVERVGVMPLSDEDDDDSPATRRSRVFAGYAGWAPGQLEGELEREGWIVEPAEPQDAFPEVDVDLWSVVLNRKGGAYALLARMPSDPTMN
jgi:putative transcriptional regulator